ncbi:GspH/FimT family protein [Pseudomonas sp. EA_35y_Pfl2_R5]|uniref:GspH/FimT family protein n=1 Tax=Pseudomonas sp. EA_35y_Pfl2_R5 TaxID=3088690 RepID=UPI0030D8C354
MLNLFQRGTTLLELLTVLSLLALLATIGLPSFVALVEKNRLIALLDELHNTLQEARTQAVTQARTIEVCAYKQGTVCGADWSGGWILRTVGTKEILRINTTSHTEGSMHWSGYSKTIRFRSNGSSPTSNGRLVVCRHNDVIGQLIVNRQGRIRHGSRDENHAEQKRCI